MNRMLIRECSEGIPVIRGKGAQLGRRSCDTILMKGSANPMGGLGWLFKVVLSWGKKRQSFFHLYRLVVGYRLSLEGERLTESGRFLHFFYRRQSSRMNVSWRSSGSLHRNWEKNFLILENPGGISHYLPHTSMVIQFTRFLLDQWITNLFFKEEKAYSQRYFCSKQ